MQSTAKVTSKGKIDLALVKAQIEKSQQYYKEVLEVQTAPLHESAHFLIVGQWRRRSSELVGGDLEQAYVTARNALKLPADAGPWPGKLSVFLLQDAKDYPKMIRLVQRRKADEDECGSHAASATFPHVVACPGKAPGELGVGGTAALQMCSLLADLKAKARLPEWLTDGFGRATLLHTGPPAALAAERRKAAAFLGKTKRSANDIFTNNLPPEESPVLRASLLDYLVYSGRTAKFVPFVEGFSGNANLDTALKKANMTSEDLSNNWLNYARSFR